MKKRDISLGILLISLGILFLLFNLGIISVNMAIFILSIGMLVGYFLDNKVLYLIGGLLLLGIAGINFLNEYAFPNVNIKMFLFLAILSIIAFIIFGKQKNRVFFMIGLIIGNFSVYSLIRELVAGNVIWSLFLLFAVSFFIYYLFGYRELDIVWPKNIGIGMMIISLISFIGSKTRVDITLGKLLSYIFALVLIIIGGKIIQNIYKSR